MNGADLLTQILAPDPLDVPFEPPGVACSPVHKPLREPPVKRTHVLARDQRSACFSADPHPVKRLDSSSSPSILR